MRSINNLIKPGSFCGILFCLLFLLFVQIPVSGSDTSSKKTRIITGLTEAGFENIRVGIDGTRIMIAYENRVFRFEYDALKEVIKIVSEFIEDGDKLLLLPENRKIPIGQFEGNGSDCKDYSSGKITGKEFAGRIKINSETDDINNEIESENLNNSSSFKTDIVLNLI